MGHANVVIVGSTCSFGFQSVSAVESLFGSWPELSKTALERAHDSTRVHFTASACVVLICPVHTRHAPLTRLACTGRRRPAAGPLGAVHAGRGAGQVWGQGAGHQHLATQVQPGDCAAPAQRLRLWRLQYHVGAANALVGVGELIQLVLAGLGPGLSGMCMCRQFARVEPRRCPSAQEVSPGVGLSRLPGSKSPCSLKHARLAFQLQVCMAHTSSCWWHLMHMLDGCCCCFLVWSCRAGSRIDWGWASHLTSPRAT